MPADKVEKIRLDQALVDRGLVETRTRAQALIMAGKVFSGERKMDKAGQKIPSDTALEVRGQDHPWVSRGGLKLAKALAHFGIDPTGLTAIDVGASTGGFTDVLLQHGARKVYAVDVGYGQLAHKLRTDDRVVVMERTNARYITDEDIPDPVAMVVCDASFIGLRTVLPAAMSLAGMVRGWWRSSSRSSRWARIGSARAVWSATPTFMQKCVIPFVAGSTSCRSGRSSV